MSAFTTKDWLAVLKNPPPKLSDGEVAAVLKDRYGLEGRLKALDSERDQNILVTLDGGEKRLLKIANASEDPAVTNFQTEAFLHVERKDPALSLSRVLRTTDGVAEFTIDHAGAPHIVRLFSWLEGIPLSAVPQAERPDNPEVLGDMLARLALDLADFDHPAKDHTLLYDPRHAANLEPFLALIDDAELHALVKACMARFKRDVLPALERLPVQVVFNDLSPRNYIVDPADTSEVVGLIDFGDMVCTPRIVDIAVACVYWVNSSATPLDRVARFVAAYHRRSPLEKRELDLLLPLMLTRAMILPLIYHWRADMFPENRIYIMHNLPQARRVLEQLSAMNPAEAAALLAEACGLQDIP
ncbi:Homoserine kinase [Alphaproteobacteria bacterium SO-S41]|nr:Homoserine kinase [Alphaproteobacteria bacterium SO-S41]